MRRTYQSECHGRANEVGGESHLVYRDTIYDDGTVRSSVYGTSDGEPVNVTEVREIEGVINWQRLHEARLRSGWRLVEECTCGDGSCVLCDDDGFRPAEATS